ncbi:hypothetical protein Tco_1575744 [Tanacetum coccineum]
MTQAQQRTYMCNYIKHIGSHTLKQLKKLSFDEVKELFETTIKRVNTFTPIESDDTVLKVVAGSSKIDVEQELNHENMLKNFDRDDLVKLWSLVHKRFNSIEPTEDKERELWVELKRLFKPDDDDILWKLQRYMHDALKWKLYDTCVVHHVSTERGHDIFMLVEKDYPLTRAHMTLILSNKLQVDEYSVMADDLLRKIFILANKPRQEDCGNNGFLITCVLLDQVSVLYAYEEDLVLSKLLLIIGKVDDPNITMVEYIRLEEEKARRHEIVSHFNDLFNDIHPDDLKSEKDDDDNDIDMAPLPAADQGHLWLRYQIEEYTEGIRIDLAVRLRMVYSGEGQQLEMAEAGFRAYCAGSDRLIPDKGDLRDYWLEILSDRDCLGPASSYVLIQDPMRRLCYRMIAYSIFGRGQAPEKVTCIDLFYLRNMDHRTINVLHLLAQYLFRHAKGRKSGARLSGGHFIGRLAMHFGLVIDDGLRGLQGQAVVAGAPKADEGDQAVEEVALEIPAPASTPPPPPPAP